MFESLKTIHKNAYAKRKIYCDEQVVRFLPKKYKDYRMPAILNKLSFPPEGLDIAVPARIISVKKNEKNGRAYTTVSAADRAGTKFSAIFMNMDRIGGYISSFSGSEILFMGTFKNDTTFGYSVFNPVWTVNVEENLRIISEYPKIKGIGETARQDQLKACIFKGEIDTIPYKLIKNYGKINDAISKIHTPNDFNDIQEGEKRLVLDNLVYLKSVMRANSHRLKTTISFNKRSKTDEMISNLPFPLTTDQRDTIDSIIKKTQKGFTQNALIQGDVGCGKTIIAFALMRCAAENGYQSILMAPTQILAGQHYTELSNLVDPGRIAYFDGTIKAKEKKVLVEKISKGEIDYIIGTSAIITADIKYKNLGLAIIDEEHRFGVEQRSGILTSAIHTITMSATPIPRSLAGAILGSDTDVYQIVEKPAGRKPVITYYDGGNKVQSFLYSILKKGSQAYVVCPLKEDSDKSDLKSVEEVCTDYKKTFEPLGFHVAMVTGATKPADKDQIISDFKDNKTSILVSTTVIEVGVNVPNANIIIIQNAERFGLATLHQLRGRVGRGNGQGYCVLVSEDQSNSRINIMCSTNDGFEVAEADLLERRSGNLIGLKQSGRNLLVEQFLAYPDIAKDAEYIVDHMTPQEMQTHINKYSFLNTES